MSPLQYEFRSSNKTWKYPTKSDKTDVGRKQNLEAGVKGEWSLVDLRNNKFMLQNAGEICSVFNKVVIHIEKQNIMW